MKMITRAVIVCMAMIGPVGTALAGGDSYKTEALPDHRWSGFYLGGHVGYGWSDKDWTLLRNAGNQPSNQIGSVITSHEADGAFGGIQVGANHQAHGLVFGIEGSMAWTGMDGYSTWRNSDGFFRDAATDINWMGTLTGKIGVPLGHTLVYFKGGAVWADEDYSHTGGRDTPRILKGGDTRLGWLIGAGAEWAWDRNWSVNFEYNYMDFGDDDISLSDGTRTALFSVDQQMHAIKLGLNYRFDWSR
jgi:outer membrane immunogenic protein